jgi:SAM-dependent methyltransferase
MTMPWWLKILLKIVVSRVPLPYRIFARFGIFRHGKMDDADYAYGVFNKHFALKPGDKPWVGAEIGPGDSIFSALLAHDHGATNFWLIDAGNFADRTLDRYKNMTNSLQQRGILKKSSSFNMHRDFDNMLENLNANYLTNGVDSLRDIPDESVDLLWSHAVLEHIRASSFSDFCKQSYRIAKPGGYASHVVDFKDHLSSGLNNLRFPSEFWEKDWFAQNSGFYTNRIRASSMRKEFENAGFEVKIISESRWNASPISRSSLSIEFAKIDDSDLLVSGMHFLLKKNS